MDEAIEDGVGIGRVADHGVPVVDGQLAGDDGGAAAVAFLEDLEKVVAGLRDRAARGPSRRGSEAGRRRARG